MSDIEIIVVDDASTDETEAVIDSYNDDRIILYKHETNQGGSGARNTGIKHANGKYVAFLDSDDEWHADKLNRQVNYLEQRSNEWQATYCDFRTKRHNPLTTFVDRRFQRESGKEGGAKLIHDLLLLQFTNGGSSTLMIKRDLVEELNGFDASFSRHQDWEFLIRLLRRTKLAYVDEVLVTKYHTGTVEYETAIRAKKRFLNKFAPEIVELAWKGAPVIERHRFMMAKVAFSNSEIKAGLSFLRRSSAPSFRDYLGLISSLFVGMAR